LGTDSFWFAPISTGAHRNRTGTENPGEIGQKILQNALFEEQVVLAVEGERLWGSYLAASISKRFPYDPITLF
jgi:hypothetical protein